MIPVHPKTDMVPYTSDWQIHRCVLFHACIPLVIHYIYAAYIGQNLSVVTALVFYSVSYNLNIIHDLTLCRRLGYIYGFFDGDKHEREVFTHVDKMKPMCLMLGAINVRQIISVFISYRTDQTPASLNWKWLPLEISLYTIVLDFWYYCLHRLAHTVNSLWKYHRTHHLAKHPSPLMTTHFDIEEGIFSIAGTLLLTFFSLKLVGLPMGFYEWWICNQYCTFTEIFGHCGIRVLATAPSTLTWLLRLFDAELVIEDHDLHHRKGWRKSHNYGKQTRLWDRIFGTCHDRIECAKNNIDYDKTVTVPLF